MVASPHPGPCPEILSEGADCGGGEVGRKRSLTLRTFPSYSTCCYSIVRRYLTERLTPAPLCYATASQLSLLHISCQLNSPLITACAAYYSFELLLLTVCLALCLKCTLAFSAITDSSEGNYKTWLLTLSLSLAADFPGNPQLLAFAYVCMQLQRALQYECSCNVHCNAMSNLWKKSVHYYIYVQCICMYVQCACSVYAVYMQYVCSVYAVYVHCMCSVHAVYLQYVCIVYAVSMQCISSVYAVSMQCLCSSYAVPMQCICITYAVSMQRTVPIVPRTVPIVPTSVPMVPGIVPDIVPMVPDIVPICSHSSPRCSYTACTLHAYIQYAQCLYTYIRLGLHYTQHTYILRVHYMQHTCSMHSIPMRNMWNSAFTWH